MKTWTRPAANSCFNTTITERTSKENCSPAILNALNTVGIAGSVEVCHGVKIDRYLVKLGDLKAYKKVLSMKQLFMAAIGSNDIRLVQDGSQIVIEVPTAGRTVTQYELMSNSHFMAGSSTSVPVGISLDGHALFTDIAKAPHMLVCGATGSGKSVFLNSIICSLLFKNSPDELQFFMVDPKRVEMAKYAPLNAMCTVYTDVDKSIGMLEAMTHYMDSRYTTLEQSGCKNIEEYREKVGAMPRVIVVIDELADLMMTAGKTVEKHICRIAQLGRAAGIHIIAATQYPKSDIVTGSLKLNLPTRVCFKVPQAVNSRVALDSNGAETLTGSGDGMFVNQKTFEPLRFQGAFIEDVEIEKLVGELAKN